MSIWGQYRGFKKIWLSLGVITKVRQLESLTLIVPIRKKKCTNQFIWSRPWGFEKLTEFNSDYEGTSARKPHSDLCDKITTPKSVDEIYAMRICGVGWILWWFTKLNKETVRKACRRFQSCLETVMEAIWQFLWINLIDSILKYFHVILVNIFDGRGVSVIFISLHLTISVCLFVCLSVCLSIYTYVCVYVCVCVCVCMSELG